MAEAISLAKELNDMHALVVALTFGAFWATLNAILLKWNAWHRN